MTTVIHIGIDVHKETYSLSSFIFSTNQHFGETRIEGKNSLVIRYVQHLIKEHEECEVLCGYEAGPTGFGLYRDLVKADIPCVVMAPTTLPKAPGARVKTDKLDARELARHLAYGTYKAVHVPTPEDEAVKNFTRLRNTRVLALKKAKQNLTSFLLRMSRSYNEGKTCWTKIHLTWLRQQKFSDEVDQEAFDEYLQEVFDQMEKVRRFDDRIEELAVQDAYREKVARLCCIKGIQTHTALSVVSEIGDFTRFANAPQFSAFLGLVPGEDSSGQREHRTGITKTGNSRLRLLLVEASQLFGTWGVHGAKSKRLLARQKGQDPAVIAYADKATRRLHGVYRRLVSKGVHHNKATVAVARELSCFIWGMMTDHIACMS